MAPLQDLRLAQLLCHLLDPFGLIDISLAGFGLKSAVGKAPAGPIYYFDTQTITFNPSRAKIDLIYIQYNIATFRQPVEIFTWSTYTHTHPAHLCHLKGPTIGTVDKLSLV